MTKTKIMALSIGSRLGPYEILSALGAGGMGEVYKARDTRLDRTVAIKVLSEEFAANAGRRERFEREARAAAALSHPHICALHDVGVVPAAESACSDGAPVRFLVMECLDGPTLAERLVRGPLPPGDVLRYASELADALDHAHRRGLIHRDLKPGNVMLTRDGAKLLDFGLSKAQPAPNLLGLSTIAPDGGPVTAHGELLGTFPYMAPEQLEGRETDARSDIFALGAVIYEMATGRRAFEGTTAASVIGAVLHTNPPPLSTLQPLAPPALDRIVARCLAKDPDDRWQSARDVRLELQWIADHGGDTGALRARSRVRRRRLLVPTALTVLLVGLVGFGLMYFRGAPADAALLRLTLSPPAGLTLAEVRTAGPVTISPDGRRVVYVAAGADEKLMLRVHSLDSGSAQALPGTEGAAYPFWSPDSRFVAFFAQGKLKRIDVAGGPPQTLCDAVQPRGGTWSRGGVIVFASEGGERLYRISSAGGAAEALTFARPNRESHWPDFLPDGRHFLYFGRREASGIYVASLDSGESKLLVPGQYVAAAYAAPGHLVILKGGAMSGTLMAQPFDADRLQLTGDATTFAEQVAFFPFYGRANFSVSATGTLVYGTINRETTRLAWFDRGGRQIEAVAAGEGYDRPSLSPDETTIAAERLDAETQSQEVWLIASARGVAARLTSDPSLEGFPVWSADGRHVVYGRSGSEEGRALYQRLSDGAGNEETFVQFDAAPSLIRQTTQLSPDGRFLVLGGLDPKTQWDLFVLPVTRSPFGGNGKEQLYLRTGYNEHHGQLSSDGRWMAYASDESGRMEVYVGAFPVLDSRTRISADGGSQPRWRRDGKELFYLSPDGTIMAVAVRSGTAFVAESPRPLFKIGSPAVSGAGWNPQYIPAGEGQRFLINVRETVPSPITVVLNWPAALVR